MKTIIFIIPYFGKFPNYFKLWLESCRFNPTIDFLIFTDDNTEYDYPQNVIVHYFTFEKIKDLFQNHFDFEISLNKPYKLCDFKPAYGEVFGEYLKGYDYWGFCDIDLIWGNIRKFLTDDVLLSAERILTHGHCSLFRNDKVVNALYRTLPFGDCLSFKTAFTEDISHCFDEWGWKSSKGTSYLYKQNGIRMYNEIIFADIDWTKAKFNICNSKNYFNQYFEYNNGSLFLKGKNVQREILYAHFQKRPIYFSEEMKYSHFYFVDSFFISNIKNKHHFILLKKIKFKINYYYTIVKRKLNKIKFYRKETKQ